MAKTILLIFIIVAKITYNYAVRIAYYKKWALTSF